MNGKRLFALAATAGAIGIGVAMVFGIPPFGSRAAENGLFASGTVEATDAQIGFEVPGKIDRVLVREGDPVQAGALVATLDPAEAHARRAQAQASLRAARAVLLELESGARPEEIGQAQAAFEGAQHKREDVARDLERTRILYDGGAVSQEAYDKAQTAFALAGSQEDQAREQLRLVRSGPRSERLEAQRAHVAQAEAVLQGAEEMLRKVQLRTPFAGTVTVQHREPGEVVPPGAPVLTLMDPDSRWVRVYIPGDQIGAVRLGATATVTSDTYPEKRYEGEVVFIASEAEFTPKNVQTAEERVKLVYAVKVRITGDPRYELKPGMPADVRLEREEP
jgi:HlyD family secretion protein